MKNWAFSYFKTKRGAKTPDFLIKTESESIILEVGGKGKGRQQFKGIKRNKKIILADPSETERIERPLFLMGLL